MYCIVQIQRKICVFGQTADSYLPNTSLYTELDTWFLNTWPCQRLWLLEWRGAGATPYHNSLVSSGKRRMGHPIQPSRFPLAVTTTGENPLLRNSMDILWPSSLVSENANRECWSRREEFADLGTSQAVSAPAASVSGWGRAAATARAVGAREAMPALRLHLGSLGGLEEADAVLSPRWGDFPTPRRLLQPPGSSCSSGEGKGWRGLVAFANTVNKMLIYA